MRMLIFADLHMCPRSSIINKWGNNYPMRLENCIASVNWLERVAEEQKCDYIINLGDFFDKPDLSSETITALNEIKWSNIMHYSLVGNHDASDSSLEFSSVNSLLTDRHVIVSKASTLLLDDCELCFLPYVTESDRKPIIEYFGPCKTKYRVIMSHNDLNGIQLGPVMSKTGFTVEEIEACCDHFINGHLHNGQVITDKIINLGNLTGKDFGEDASRYSHNIAIFDTKMMTVEFIENPYAFNFYKIKIETEADIVVLETLKNNAVCSIMCDSELIETVRSKVNELASNILEARIISVKKYSEASGELNTVDLSVDHLARFIECCKSSIENTTILEEELNEVCK